MVDRWLADRGVAFRTKPEPDARGRTVYVLGACPFDPAHADPDACVMQAPNGQLAAHCFHNGCTGHGWHAFKQRIGAPEPHHFDPPLTRPTRGRKTRAERPAPMRPEGPPGAPPDAQAPGPEETRDGARPEIVIDPATTPVARTMCALTDVLIGARECYHRAGQLVRVTGTAIKPVLSAPELAGLLNHHAEVLVVGESGPAYKPLPVNYANTWLNHPGEAARLPAIALFTQNPVFTADWRLVPPGFDPPSGTYYAGPAIEPRAGTGHLDALLADFCFRTPGDRTNYVGVLLTTILMPHFVGSKPAVLFSGNQPGLGKTILAQVIATLRDGKPAETATYNPNDEEFEKRLGAVVHRGATTIIVDNAKGQGRAARIDSACLERSITDATLSFRLLGHSREIRAENSHIFCLTANTPEVSRDLVTRCVLVDLFHEGDPTRRAFAIIDPEGYTRDHRAEFLGELVGMVARWRGAGSPEADVASRFNKKGWGRIVGGILAHAGLPGFLANAETAAAELDDTRREFAYLVGILADHPQGTWTAAELAALAADHGLFPTELKDASPHARTIRMGLLAGRYIDLQFVRPDGRTVAFQRSPDRFVGNSKGNYPGRAPSVRIRTPSSGGLVRAPFYSQRTLE